MTQRLRQELKWILCDEMNCVPQAEAARAEEALRRLLDAVPAELRPLVQEVELAFLARETEAIEAACLIGMRWGSNPMDLAMVPVNTPSVEVRHAISG